MVRMDGSYPEFLTDILDFGPNCSTFEFGPHTFEPPPPPAPLWASGLFFFSLNWINSWCMNYNQYSQNKVKNHFCMKEINRT